jgi:hypothetical protein
MTEEIWKPVPGYEGRYEVSDLGRVRSLDREIICMGEIKGSYVSRKKGRVLRPGPSNYGHLSVVLGRGKTRMVHELVLRAFVGEPPDKHECCHNNGDPTDNRLSNLRWGTRSENSVDAVKHGSRGKLTAAQVREIRQRLATCAHGDQTKLAAEYGVSLCTINSIKFNRIYKHV